MGRDDRDRAMISAWLRRLEVRTARFLFGLSPRAKVLLSGGRPIRIDEQTLDPEFQLLLKLRSLRRGARDLHAGTPEQARSSLRHETIHYTGETAAVRSVRDLVIAGGAGPIPARHYAPDEPGGPHPLLVFFHGGGFVSGDLDTHDAACRFLCRESGVHVLAVAYRLAPEHPFPAAIDDATAAFRWAQRHAGELFADPGRVGVGGDSAGGNLAGGVALLSRRDGGRPAAFQLLIYPAVEPHVLPRRSMQLFSDGFLLTRADVAWYDRQYLGSPADHLKDPRVNLLAASDPSNSCPAIIVTAGFDPLRDEGEAYAAALGAAGNAVHLRRFEGFVHGFINMIGVSDAACGALREIAGAMREVSREVAPRAA